MVLSHGGSQAAETVLVAITIPQASFLENSYVTRRTEVNSMIKQYCAEKVAESNSNSSSSRIICVDLENAIPYYDTEGERDDVHWDDDLHMTPAGYDRFGREVFTAVESVLERLFKMDEKVM